MGLSINTNIAAMNSYRNLSATQGDLSSSLEKLSSGLRINRAADDAAGLAISEGLRAQIGGTKQAVRNAQDGISVVQTAEGALTETHSILQRMRTLSVQAANTGGLSAAAKSNIQDEIGELSTELDRIAKTTQFNGAKLLDGTYSGVFHVGANTGDDNQIKVGLTTTDLAGLATGVTGTGGLSSGGLGLTGIDVTADSAGGTTAAQASATQTNLALTAVNTMKGGTALTGTPTAADVQTALQTAAGANYAVTVTANATTPANYDVTVKAVAAGVAGNGAVTGLTGVTLAGGADAVGGTGGPQSAITAIDNAIEAVSKVRSQLGAVQNRFDHTINNLNVAVENLSASESRIRDTDMAEEMVAFTRAQILSQAGTAMLAQAKALPQSVLQLLQ
ncbi:MAG: flagellin [Cellulomonas sp.]|jgi:flagellin|uniref:flagellin N-terminal helical domain-containing protein n=1 Tax=Cellulomonas sp. TaxID=40001 RepID=UPI0019F4B82C|nr:flagellin [Cellulomonas sp.]MBF0689196.1 flagellin [Cellulomonas sp.]